MQLIQEQGKLTPQHARSAFAFLRQGQGKHVTLEAQCCFSLSFASFKVIRKLQQQSEAVQREVETRGAFPWKVNWQC